MYKHRSTVIDGLEAAIRQTVNEIPQEMVRRVMKNLRNRLQQCIVSRGRQHENVMSQGMLAFTRSIVLAWLKKHRTPPKKVGRQQLPPTSATNREKRCDQTAHDVVESNQNKRRRSGRCQNQSIYVCNKCEVSLHYKCSVE